MAVKPHPLCKRLFICPRCGTEFRRSRGIKDLKNPPCCSPECSHLMRFVPRITCKCACGCGMTFEKREKELRKYYSPECGRFHAGKAKRIKQFPPRQKYEAIHCYPDGRYCERYNGDCFGHPRFHKRDGSCRVEPARVSAVLLSSSLGGMIAVRLPVTFQK